MLSENPARLYGCWPRKGLIAPGSDGDIVVLDPASEGAISVDNHVQNVDYTPYEGWRTKCSIVQVYLRGNLAADRGQVLDPRGRFIPRGRCCL